MLIGNTKVICACSSLIKCHLSFYIVIRDAVCHFYSYEIYWFKLFTVLYILLVLPIEPVNWLLVI